VRKKRLGNAVLFNFSLPNFNDDQIHYYIAGVSDLNAMYRDSIFRISICSSLSGMDPIASSSAPGGNNFVFSPGGQSLSYSYGRSMGMGAQRTRGGALQTARGTGRKVTPVIKDANDPLHGVRKKMPYENLVKELENNPDAEIRR